MGIVGAFNTIGKVMQALTVVEGVTRLAGSRQTRTQNEEQNMSEKNKRTVMEEIEVEGQQLVERIKELLREGNVRRLRVKDAKGKYLLEVPLTFGVVAGGVFMLAAPTLTALGALAGLLANVRIEIVREVDEDEGEGGGEP
jgi:hypothetical protein